MYHVRAHGVDEHMINVHHYYYYITASVQHFHCLQRVAQQDV